MGGETWRRAISGPIPLLIATSLLLAIIGITGLFVAEQENTAAELLKAIEASNALPKLLSTLQDAETGQRGYLLTGRESYLTPFTTASDDVEPQFKRLRALYADRPTTLDKLAALKTSSDAKLSELRRTIELRKSGDAQSALQVVNSDIGLQLMNQARATIRSLEDDSYHLIVARQGEARAVGRRVAAAIFASVVLTLALAAFVLANARSRERRLSGALGDLRGAHAELVSASENREKLESQLRQAQKMESLGHLTGGLAHDFNNMLAIIIGNLNLMRRRPAADIGRFIDNAMEGAERATALIQRLLAFSRHQPLSPEVLQLNRLVPGVSEMLRRTLGESIQLEVILGGGLWLTQVDANQLESAVVNLAVNARDAMPDGGRLTIETANAHLDEAYAAENHGVAAGQYVLVAISDSGTGMAPDIVTKAFDPFFTTKGVGKGTGLGLSQVYGFIKQSAGHIKIYSEPGSGTTVKIYVPRSFAAPGEARLRTPGASEAEVPLGTPRELILVVEDEDRGASRDGRYPPRSPIFGDPCERRRTRVGACSTPIPTSRYSSPTWSCRA